MSPLTLLETSVNSFKYSMRFAYQRSDLSVRLNFNDYVASNSLGVTLKTNSLAELQRPENRFAHYTMPLRALGLGTAPPSDPQGTTLPLLALTSEATGRKPQRVVNGPGHQGSVPFTIRYSAGVIFA